MSIILYDRPVTMLMLCRQCMLDRQDNPEIALIINFYIAL